MSAQQSRVNPLTLLLCLIVGFGVGLLMQTYRSGVGLAPFSPPVSLAASMVIIAAVLLVLAFRLKRVIKGDRGVAVNPFHAVRLLVAARASQLTGALFTGFGLGLLMMFISRITELALSTWLDPVLVVIAALVLFIAGILAERACRVPPSEGDEESIADRDEQPGTAQGNISA